MAIARDVDDPALLARTLTAYGFIAGQSYHDEVARECFAEAIVLARALDDQWRLSQILAQQARGAHIAGDPLGIRAAGEEGRDLANAIGDGFNSRLCRFCLAVAQQFSGDLAGAAIQLGEAAAEAEAAHDEISRVTSLVGQSMALGGRVRRPRPERRPRRPSSAARSFPKGTRYSGTQRWGSRPWPPGILQRRTRRARRSPADDCRERWHGAIGRIWNAEAALADGDLAAARRWADEAASTRDRLVADVGAGDARAGGDRGG